jgi:hypothetical protein
MNKKAKYGAKERPGKIKNDRSEDDSFRGKPFDVAQAQYAYEMTVTTSGDYDQWVRRVQVLQMEDSIRRDQEGLLRHHAPARWRWIATPEQKKEYVLGGTPACSSDNPLRDLGKSYNPSNTQKDWADPKFGRLPRVERNRRKTLGEQGTHP